MDLSWAPEKVQFQDRSTRWPHGTLHDLGWPHMFVVDKEAKTGKRALPGDQNPAGSKLIINHKTLRTRRTSKISRPSGLPVGSMMPKEGLQDSGNHWNCKMYFSGETSKGSQTPEWERTSDSNQSSTHGQTWCGLAQQQAAWAKPSFYQVPWRPESITLVLSVQEPRECPRPENARAPFKKLGL